MTDKVREGIDKIAVNIHTETKSGFFSDETFATLGRGTDVDTEVIMLKAVDELNRMLLLSGTGTSVLEHRLSTVIESIRGKRVEPPNPHFQD